jgi:aminoglycoside phosphotransferase (APT) family kinase protein
MRDAGKVTARDLARSDALADYLVEIHSVRQEDPGLYRRRIRELVGHGECIMGIADSYPAKHGFIDRALLEAVEHDALGWRWRLRDYEHRLCQIHGDFHPWNILFADATPGILDRSRGEWGEAADDVSCLTINYLFFSLQRSGRLEGGFKDLFERFWDRYVTATGDDEIRKVVAPFFAFRGLVIASPVWYPDLDEAIRRRLFAFVRNVMDDESFDPQGVNRYCEA